MKEFIFTFTENNSKVLEQEIVNGFTLQDALKRFEFLNSKTSRVLLSITKRG